MTKLKVKSGQDVYTNLAPSEVRQYLSGGSKAGTIVGYMEAEAITPIIIAVHAIVFIYA